MATSKDYRFTRAHLLVAARLLKTHDFLNIFQNIEIPERWKTSREVYCVDQFKMTKKSKLTIYDFNGDGKDYKSSGDEDYHLNLSMINENGNEYNCGSCAGYAKFLYDLILFVQNENIE